MRVQVNIAFIFITLDKSTDAPSACFTFGNIVLHASRLETAAASEAMAYKWFFQALFGVNIKQPLALLGRAFLDENLWRVVFYPFVFKTCNVQNGRVKQSKGQAAPNNKTC